LKLFVNKRHETGRQDIALNELKRQFHRLGMRFTSQRRRIFELFENCPRGLTITEAVATLRDEGVGEVTIYRTVKALQEIGRLRWVHDQNGEHRFVACTSEHSHPLVCKRCGKVTEFETCELSLIEKLLSIQTGFTIEGHHLEFYGVCPNCNPVTEGKNH